MTVCCPSCGEHSWDPELAGHLSEDEQWWTCPRCHVAFYISVSFVVDLGDTPDDDGYYTPRTGHDCARCGGVYPAPIPQ